MMEADEYLIKPYSARLMDGKVIHGRRWLEACEVFTSYSELRDWALNPGVRDYPQVMTIVVNQVHVDEVDRLEVGKQLSKKRGYSGDNLLYGVKLLDIRMRELMKYDTPPRVVFRLADSIGMVFGYWHDSKWSDEFMGVWDEMTQAALKYEEEFANRRPHLRDMRMLCGVGPTAHDLSGELEGVDW